ncbi:DUF4178 domain-containing protein [Patulibacter brassicae]|jgi:hypothetical protein|uniref:DUF4178 domain-containing protein n=1 Tax=Patulibacter brassicae TaxID=1705717 RepID=A0ABU4VJ28_9ACTN|nr:DUF4178 domain-containing protein [Patulibacter brassicae]MDX8151840.1 DUF4178 domain-containing protein [Patulibacter brassicae]
MVAVIVIVVLVALGAAIGIWWSKRDRAGAGSSAIAAPVDPLAEGPGGPLDGLGIGAVVSHQGHDYVVRGQIRFDEDGYVWTEYHLDTGTDGEAGRAWLSVDVSDGTDVAFWRPADDAGELEPSGPVTYAGRTYKKVESGAARFTASGTTGVPDAGKAWYVDYQAEGGRRLGFERWSSEGSWEVSVGETVPVHLLEIYPAGRTSAGA